MLAFKIRPVAIRMTNANHISTEMIPTRLRERSVPVELEMLVQICPIRLATEGPQKRPFMIN